MTKSRLFLLLCAGLSPLLLACGPWLPSLLLINDKQQAVRPPAVDLITEFRRLPDLPKLPAGIPAHPFNTDDYRERFSGNVIFNKNEDRDFETVMTHYRVPTERRAGMAADYRAIRSATNLLRDPQLIELKLDQIKRSEFRLQTIPADLPGEISDYLEGAFAFHSGEVDLARATWQRLLERPLEERRYRSTWATYMLARMALWKAGEDEQQRAEARRLLQRVRALVQEGCADGLNLVGESYFWEGTLEPDVEKEAELYGLALASGSCLGVDGLTGVASTILDSKDAALRERAIRSPLLRQLVTARLLARLFSRPLWSYGPLEPEEGREALDWLDTIEAAGATDAPNADRLAWVAYDSGDFSRATRWLKLAPEDSPIACWLRAKLALRAGRTDEAARLFARSARHFAQPAAALYPDHQWWESADPHLPTGYQINQWQADRGLVALARADFPLALDSLLRSGAWLDAAHVAEQVMTTNELLAYVRRHFPTPPPPVPPPANPDLMWPPDDPSRADISSALRYLLARRLAREQRFTEARPFYPLAWQGRLDEYVAAWRRGHNRKLSALDRSTALWQAAGLYRHLGMELFGTEAGPDWAYYGGAYSENDIGRLRAGQPVPDWLGRGFQTLPWLPAVSPLEIARQRRLQVQPDKRFHYRYLAADLAWEAAHLRPPDEESAHMLAVAGSWLKLRDAEAADRFYQALAGRCKNTRLGQEAEVRRWFPPVDDEWSSLQQ